MQINPYLNFNGNCEAAFNLYERVLGGKIVFKMTHGESPMAASFGPDWQNKIMHASLAIGDPIIQGPTFLRSTTPNRPATARDRHQRSRRSRAHLQRPLRRWKRHMPLRRPSGPRASDVHRSVRHPVDGQLRKGRLILTTEAILKRWAPRPARWLG